jgi:penicillin-insensitive murein endopeptidase
MRSALLLAFTLAAAPARAEPPPAALAWSRLTVPSVGPAQSIGGYSAGCIAGAVALPRTGEGFEVARPQRQRFFGHPVLVEMIRDLGGKLAARHLPALSVGDLGQARGGPAPNGHASHQNGLDVDLWFVPPKGDDTVSMVDETRRRPSARFTEEMVDFLELAAADGRVDRIFINPVLKRSLCERPPSERSWLHKLAPWWGHDDHVHVRLACPADSPGCVPQPPLAAGDGCADLAWWFDDKAQAERKKAQKRYVARVGAAPELPPACRALLDAPASPP